MQTTLRLLIVFTIINYSTSYCCVIKEKKTMESGNCYNPSSGKCDDDVIIYDVATNKKAIYPNLVCYRFNSKEDLEKKPVDDKILNEGDSDGSWCSNTRIILV